MDQLSAWGPTLVTIICWIFFAGVVWQKQAGQEKRSDEHEERLNEHENKLNAAAIEISKLQAWKDGYAAARALYDQRSLSAHAGGD